MARGTARAATGAPSDTPAPVAAEKDYYRTILDAAHLYGWIGVHFRPARTIHGWRTAVQGDGQGFVDMVLAHPRGGVMFLEVKRDGGKLRPEQEAWAAVLKAAEIPDRLTYWTLYVPTQLGDLWAELERRAAPTERRRHPVVAAVEAATDFGEPR